MSIDPSKIYVITSSDAVMNGCWARHGHMQKLLAQMARHKPVPDENWEEVVIEADGPLGALGWNPSR